jgi:hypothetical protein
MARGRSVEPFEPVLIEERRKRWLAERRFPDNAEQRGHRLVFVALHQRESSSALGRFAIDCVRTGSKPELDEPSSLGRSQCKMGDLMQDYVSFGSTIQCCSVPIEAARGPFRVDRHAKAARERERRAAISLHLGSDCAVG